MQTVSVHIAYFLFAGDHEITCAADISHDYSPTPATGCLDLAILEDPSGKDEDTKNVDKENMIHEETSSEATQGKTNKGRRTKKAESSEESAEKHTSYLSFLVRHQIF